MTVLTQQNISVRTEEDRVLLKIGNAEAKLPYAGAHRIAQRLRLEAKAAMDAGNEDSRNWRGIVGQNRMDFAARDLRLGGGKAHSKATRSVPIFAQGALVVMQLGGQSGLEVKMEPDAALVLSGWLRDKASIAGRWAGDEGGSLILMGRLRNAS